MRSRQIVLPEENKKQLVHCRILAGDVEAVAGPGGE